MSWFSFPLIDPFDRELALKSEITFDACLRDRRYDRNEERAIVDLFPYLPVPSFPARNSLRSNQTSIPAVLRAPQIHRATSASCEA